MRWAVISAAKHRTNSIDNLNIWCLFLYVELLRFPYFCLQITKFKSSLSADVVKQQKIFISRRSSVFWTGTKWPRNWKHISIKSCCLLPGEESVFLWFLSATNSMFFLSGVKQTWLCEFLLFITSPKVLIWHQSWQIFGGESLDSDKCVGF